MHTPVAHKNLNYVFSLLLYYCSFFTPITPILVASVNLPDWSGLKAFLFEVKAKNACFQRLNANVLFDYCSCFAFFIFKKERKNLFTILHRDSVKTEQPLFYFAPTDRTVTITSLCHFVFPVSAVTAAVLLTQRPLRSALQLLQKLPDVYVKLSIVAHVSVLFWRSSMFVLT